MEGSSKSAEAVRQARKAGLRYVNDRMAGICRERRDEAFIYYLPDGDQVEEQETLNRISSLVIPPAWEKVWICPLPNGHLQATGYDARGRKQYRYHPDWSHHRNSNKFQRVGAFIRALPSIRKRVNKDLRQRELTRHKVVATVVSLMEKAFIRIGNAEYARQNNSFGLTTLHDEHVEIKGTTIRFHFRGKRGVEHYIKLQDKRLARIVRMCRDIPGYELFQYYDEKGDRHTIDSGDINMYLKDATGEEFSAKDFRTWAGTLLAFNALRDAESRGSAAERKKKINETIKYVASRLGNTPPVCRKYYIHPFILDAFEKANLHAYIQLIRDRIELPDSPLADEALLLGFLEGKWKKKLEFAA